MYFTKYSRSYCRSLKCFIEIEISITLFCPAIIDINLHSATESSLEIDQAALTTANNSNTGSQTKYD